MILLDSASAGAAVLPLAFLGIGLIVALIADNPRTGPPEADQQRKAAKRAVDLNQFRLEVRRDAERMRHEIDDELRRRSE